MASTTRALFAVEVANLGRVRRQLIFIALMVCAFLLGGMPEIVTFVCAALVTSMSMASLNAELTHGVALCYASLPVTRRDVVASHFRFAGLLTIAAFVIVVICYAVSLVIHPGIGGGRWLLTVGALMMATVCIAIPVGMPARLKFGTMGASITIAIVMTLAAIGASLAPRAVLHFSGARGEHATPALIGVVAAIIVLLAISWTASYLITQRTYGSMDL